MESIREIARILSRAPDESSLDGLDDAVAQALAALRRSSGLEVAFLSRFKDGQRKFEVVDQADGVNVLTAGTFGPLEDRWCSRVADGNLWEASRRIAQSLIVRLSRAREQAR